MSRNTIRVPAPPHRPRPARTTRSTTAAPGSTGTPPIRCSSSSQDEAADTTSSVHMESSARSAASDLIRSTSASSRPSAAIPTSAHAGQSMLNQPGVATATASVKAFAAA